MNIKIFTLLLFILCLALVPPKLYAFPPIVVITGDSLTLEVKNTPLRSVLEEVAEQGIIVRIDPSINPLISASFKRRPLNTAFSAILKDFSYSLVWDSGASPSSEEIKLSEIKIFQQGQKQRMRVLKTDQNLRIVRGGNGSFHVRNTLLVSLDTTAQDSTLPLLLNQFGATLVEVNESLGIFRLHLPEDVDIEKLAKVVSELPGIAFAEPDYAYPLSINRSLLPGSQLAAETIEATPPLGGIAVAVLDSGLSENLTDEPFIQGSFDAISPGSNISDPLGHGTQMSLIAAGVVNPMGRFTDTSDKSSVVSIRAFDDNGFTSNYALLQGIDYAINAEARVLSMSWGTETKSSVLASAVQHATNNGLILVAAAGNSPTGVPIYPAAYDNVIGVGALMPDGTVWQNSNYGDFVTIYAPGLADLPVGHDGDPGIYAGTSIATAYAARQIAEILASNPDVDITTILQNLAQDKSTGIQQ
ncbi:MAG: S8 family peptidase [Desulforhopalus sp.]